MTRLPPVSRDSLAPEGQEVWDRVATSRGGVSGPHSVLIRVPALSEHVRALGDYFRAGGELPLNDAELAILATVREPGARYAWNRRALPADLFARGLAELGEQQLVELVTLVGYYNLIGGFLNCFEVPPPDDSPT